MPRVHAHLLGGGVFVLTVDDPDPRYYRPLAASPAGYCTDDVGRDRTFAALMTPTNPAQSRGA